MDAVGLAPGDVLVVTVDRPLSLDAAGQVRARVEAAWPGHDVVLLDGMSLQVVRPIEEEEHDG